MTKDELIAEFKRLFPEELYSRELVRSGVDYPPETIIVQNPEDQKWNVMTLKL